VAPDFDGRDHKNDGQCWQQKAIWDQPEQAAADEGAEDRAGRHSQNEGPVAPEHREALIAAVPCVDADDLLTGPRSEGDQFALLALTGLIGC
jgi:hypothetical protein